MFSTFAYYVLGLYTKGEINMLFKVKSLFKRHFQDNFIFYSLLAITFVLGILIGSIIANRLDKTKSIELANYMNVFLKHINHGKYSFKDVFLSSLFINYKVIFLIWIFGLMGIGLIIIPIIMCWNGINIGFLVGFLVKNYGLKGFMFSLMALLPQYLIILPSLLIVTAIALSNSVNMKKNKKRRYLSKNIADYSMSVLVFSLLIVLGCIIEGFYTQYFVKFIMI